jgi:hypothetical protein
LNEILEAMANLAAISEGLDIEGRIVSEVEWFRKGVGVKFRGVGVKYMCIYLTTTRILIRSMIIISSFG